LIGKEEAKKSEIRFVKIRFQCCFVEEVFAFEDELMSSERLETKSRSRLTLDLHAIT
jgi:hypothetical protein